MARAHYVKCAAKPNSAVSKKDIERAKKALKELARDKKRKTSKLTEEQRQRLNEDPEAGSYWWWKFRWGGKHVSKSQPRPSQLTQSEYLGTMLGHEETFNDISASGEPSDIASTLQSLAEEVQTVGDECREKKENMPDSLQESETGELLEQRADACDELASELERIQSEVEALQEDYDDARENWGESDFENIASNSAEDVEAAEEEELTKPRSMEDVEQEVQALLDEISWDIE